MKIAFFVASYLFPAEVGFSQEGGELLIVPDLLPEALGETLGEGLRGLAHVKVFRKVRTDDPASPMAGTRADCIDA